MTSTEFADHLNECIMNDAEPDPALEGYKISLLESRFSSKGKIINLFFTPADAPYDGMPPMARLAQDMRDYFALTDDRSFAIVRGIADRISKLSDPQKADHTVFLPDGVEWRGIPVSAAEALRDFRAYRMDNPVPERTASPS